MLFQHRLEKLLGLGALSIVVASGCSSRQLNLPNAVAAAPSVNSDAQSAQVLAQPEAKPPMPRPSTDGKKTFELPERLPGATANDLIPPQLPLNAPQAEREKWSKNYPQLVPVKAAVPVSDAPVSLAELQQIALELNPALRMATADAESALGVAIQAGLHPNPTVGYQSDQVEPALRIPAGQTYSGAGQQGGFINQLIKTCGKLQLAQQVAGYGYINALIAVRQVHFTIMANVRGRYFAALVAQESLEVNKALAQMADEVYRLQLRQTAAGLTARYEPLQLYAQAVQARNNVIAAEKTYQAAWRQLAAAVGEPNLPISALNGKVDKEAPVYDLEQLKNLILSSHTDILMAKNTISQAQTNLVLQRRIPYPDIATNMYHQYDNAGQTYQYGLQIGFATPIFDRNQGNIRSARAQIASAGFALTSKQNDLLGLVSEAFGRYEANVQVAANYRDRVLPSLTQAYQMLIRRYQVEPDKVGFNDVVVAQQNMAQALQAYLAALGAQWQAVVDVATISQLDELYSDKGKPVEGQGNADGAVKPEALPAPKPMALPNPNGAARPNPNVVPNPNPNGAAQPNPNAVPNANPNVVPNVPPAPKPDAAPMPMIIPK